MPNPDPSPATRFAPGRSGNPAGRPKGESLTASLRRYLDGEDKDGRPRAERFAEKLAEMVLLGDIQAMKMVLDRIDGKAVDRIGLETEGMTIRVVYDDPKEDRPIP
jgi:hypothetical protein